MKTLRDQVLTLVMALIDEWARTGDERYRQTADEIISVWLKIFGHFNDPDPRVPKAGEPLREDM